MYKLLPILLLSGCASVVMTVPPQPVAPVLGSVQEADRILATVAGQRASAEAHYAVREHECYSKFFVTSCLDEAKEMRRAELAKLRVAEVEAGRYKRQAAVDEHALELAKAQKDYEAEQARLAAEPPPPPRAPVLDEPPPAPHAPVDRQAEQAARLKQQAAQDAAAAPKRAAAAAAYDKRKQESEQRQADVARRKAEKAAKLEQSRKDQADKAEADRAAAAAKASR